MITVARVTSGPYGPSRKSHHGKTKPPDPFRSLGPGGLAIKHDGKAYRQYCAQVYAREQIMARCPQYRTPDDVAAALRDPECSRELIDLAMTLQAEYLSTVSQAD